MKKLILTLALAAVCGIAGINARSLVILHTNDTHSHIDAENGVGGVLQRKAIIDSVRRAEKNVMVVDAGDIVQGSLYFKLFGGEVEYPLMDMMNYDIQIVGNHEFDNGLEELAKYYKRGGAAKISSNYDFSRTPLNGVFDPYIIKNIGGKKVGFLGLNLDPEGMISPQNYAELQYSEIIGTANATAALLRKKGCDLVVAVTHIGYSDDSEEPKTTDVDLARASKGIDIIISGHSHEVVSSDTKERPNVFTNAEGKPVLIAQTGRYGANIGYIKIDMDRIPAVSEARMIPVAGVNPAKFDSNIASFLKRYRHDVDSVNSRQIAVCDVNMLNTKQYASSTLLSNFTADVVYKYACNVADSIGMPKGVDLAIVNCGGIRLPMDAGVVTEGQILSTYPFINFVEIVETSGSQLKAILTQAALQKGQAVSEGVWIGLSADGKNVDSILINGEPIDADNTYRIATLDYLTAGGDYQKELKKVKILWHDSKELCAPMMNYIVNLGRAGIPINPDPRPRIVTVKRF